jgi:type 1 glutamine amidotransferase
MTRRDFLSAPALAAPLAAQTDSPLRRPMRWIQIAFVEDDPGRFDLNFWLDYAKRIHADAATLSAGGCIAFYPTKVPLHYRSKFLGSGDAFGDLAAGCRKLGMNVVARIDPHACHDDVHQAHPDWIAVDESGKPRRHWASPQYWVTCGLGPYNFEFMTEVVREIVTLYDVDGVFANRWSGSGMCYCKHCEENFRRFSGLALPRGGGPRDPARRQYILWRQQRLFELWDLWDAEIRRIRPAAAFIPNTGGGATSEMDMVGAAKRAPTLFADRQARRGVMPPWGNGKNGKEYRSTFRDKPVAGIFSVGVEEPYRWKDSVQSPAEFLVWAADGIAQGLNPWITKFNAKPLDRRWFKPVEDLYVWHWKNEKYLRNTQSLARVGMVYSQQTARFYGAQVEQHADGFYHALVEARIPFEMVHDQLLDEESLKPFSALVLPNLAALSAAQCAQLSAFVERGGGIVCTHETSLCDEWGERRADFGLRELFGCSYAGATIARQQNAYINIELREHALLEGLRDAGRFIHGVQRVEIRRTDAAAEVPLTTLPSYPDLPMEEVYPRVERTDIPAALCRAHGRGRVVYFPFDIDRTFWEVMSPDHGRLLANAVLWAANEEQPAQVRGPGVVDIGYWRQKDSVTLCLVNLTNPMMMKGPFREFLPVGPQRVRLRLPAGAKPRSVKLLVSGAAPPWRFDGGWFEMTTPAILLHEVVAIDV